MGRRARPLKPVLAPQDLRVVTALYRSLLRLGTKFDRFPAAKMLLYRSESVERPPLAVLPDNAFGANSYYSSTVDKIFKKNILLTPKLTAISFRKLIRTEFSRDLKMSTSLRMQCAFKAIRRFSNVWSVFDVQVKQKLHLQRSQDHAPEIDLTESVPSRPKLAPFASEESLFSGVVLVAHPLLHGPLSRAMILILQHDEVGSYGVIINHRSKRTLPEIVKNLPDVVVEIFGSNLTHFGGPVRRLQTIHRCFDLEGTKIPLKSPSSFQLFSGGLTARNLSALSKSDENNASKDFHFFTGCCTWNPGELREQVAEGYWCPVLMSSDDVWRVIQDSPPNNVYSETGGQRETVDSSSVSSSFRSNSDTDASSDPPVSGSNQQSSPRIIEHVDGMHPEGRSRNEWWVWLVSILGHPHAAASAIPFSLDVEDVEPVD